MDHFYDMPKGGVYDLPNPGFLPPLWPWLQSVINVGGHGVELFFMISGFLIPASLVRHGYLSKFFFDRVLRIMPVFLVLHFTLFIVGPIVSYKFFRGIDIGSYLQLFFANMFFLQDVLGLPIAQQNAWTLTYEWAFYIWFALAFVAQRRGGWLLAVPLIALGLVCLLRWPMTISNAGCAISRIWRNSAGPMWSKLPCGSEKWGKRARSKPASSGSCVWLSHWILI